MKIDLNKKIEFGGKKDAPQKQKKTVLPTKTTINLAMKEENSITPRRLAVYIAAALLAAVVVAKFGFIDQYARVNGAKAQYETVHAQYTQTEDALSHYAEVESQYLRYSKTWMQDEDSDEYVGVDRAEILDLVEKDMMSVGKVDGLTVKGNVMVANMSGMDLEQISKMFTVLDKEPLVQSLALTIAQTEDDAAASVLKFSVTMQLQQPTSEEAQG
jgi:hypothetical protein